MKNIRILAFGNPVYDLITTPLLTRTERVLSGCSTNACLAVSRLGYPASLVGTIGEDFRQRITTELSAWGIEAHLLDSKQTGGFSLHYYDDQGNRNLTVLGIADPIPANTNSYREPGFILLGPILSEIPVELVKHLRASSKAPILLDPQGLLRIVQDGEIRHELTQAFIDISRLATIIKANELETLVATGINPRLDPEGAVRALHRFGCRIAITTLAEAGSIIYDGQAIYPIPPFTTTAIDPTGAGDTYAGGFMVRYLETPQDLTGVGCFASSVASIMVENSGPNFDLTRKEVDRRTSLLLKGPLSLKL